MQHKVRVVNATKRDVAHADALSGPGGRGRLCNHSMHYRGTVRQAHEGTGLHERKRTSLAHGHPGRRSLS